MASKVTRSIPLTSTGKNSVTLLKLNVSGSGFSTEGPALPITLSAGQSTSLTVAFVPVAMGTSTGALSVVSTAMNSPMAIPLSGEGVASTQPPTISAQPGNQMILAGQTATFTVAASGTAPLSY